MSQQGNISAWGGVWPWSPTGPSHPQLLTAHPQLSELTEPISVPAEGGAQADLNRTAVRTE